MWYNIIDALLFRIPPLVSGQKGEKMKIGSYTVKKDGNTIYIGIKPMVANIAAQMNVQEAM